MDDERSIPDDPDALADRLFGAAEEAVARNGFHFGEGARMDLRVRAENGARMILSGDVRSAPAAQLVAEAEANFARFAEAMIEARSTVYAPDRLGENLVGEDTFAWALSRLCPIFPIC